MSTTLERIKASSADLTSTDANKRAKALEIKRRYQEGLFNAELEAEGAKPVPIKQPRFDFSKVDMAKAMDMPQKDELMSRAPNETATDIKETGTALMDTAKNTMQGVKDIATDDDYNLIQKGTGILGKLAGGVSGAVGDVATGAGKALLSQDAENSLKQIATGIAQGVAETDTAKALVDWYGSLDKDNKLIVDSLGGMAAFMADVFTAGAAGTVAKPLVNATGEVLEAGNDLLKTGAKTVGEGMDAVADSRKAARAQELDDVVGRIVQGEKVDREAAKRALQQVDLDGVETYEDLTRSFDESINEYTKRVDAEYAKDPTLHKAFDLARKTDVKGIDGTIKPVYDAPVLKALDDLEKWYTAVGDVAKKTQIAQYRTKLDAAGLTTGEVNSIARMHGKDLNAFNANGELSTGLTKQAAENTRSGLKDVARQHATSDAPKALDKSISDMIATRDLVKKMEEQVNKAEQKRRQHSLGSKVGGFLFEVLDTVSLGGVRGILGKVNLKAGAKNYDVVELQKNLKKQIAQFEKLNSATSDKKYAEELVKMVEEAQPGMSIRKTITPASVAKKIDKEDYHSFAKLADDPSLRTTDDKLGTLVILTGLKNATDDEIRRFAKDVVDEFDGVAERPLLQTKD